MSIIVPEQLLVLGAGLEENGTPSRQTSERALGAVNYYAEHTVELVVFSGGHSHFTPERKIDKSEAELMAGLAIEEGLPENLVRLETGSTTTLTNFINSKRLLAPELPMGVLAHAWQVPRALLIGRKVLEQPLKGVFVLGVDSTEIRSNQEKALFLASRLILAGIKQVIARQYGAEMASSKTSQTRQSL